jgi:hypothetical protein
MKNYNNIKHISLFFVLIILTIIFTLCFISCSGSADFTEKPIGNSIDITMKDRTNYADLELLFIYEDTLYTLYADSKVFPIPVAQIEEISVSGYSDRNWIFAVVGLQVVPPLLMGITASSQGFGGAWGLTGVMLIPAAIEFALFESSTPDVPVFKNPLENNAPALKKYARYPIELSRENINTIEKFYGLTKVRNITKQE